MTDLTQASVERSMYQDGKDAVVAAMLKAEEAGRASQNRYSAHINDNFVLPLAGVIARDIACSKPGQHKAHVVLLKPLEPERVAALAVRTVVNTALVSTKGAANHRAVGYGIGRTIHRELVLAQVEVEAPELYHTLARDLARRLSTDERHRVKVYKDQAKKAGINIAEWGIGSRDQVGLYLLGKLEELGLVELGQVFTVNNRVQYRTVMLAPDIIASIDQISGFIAETSPQFGPCVEQPHDWKANTGGGFHTKELQRVHRMLVKCSTTARSAVREHSMPVVWAAANALQRTRWAINSRILDVVTEMSRLGLETKEVVSAADKPRPARAAWMDTTDKESMTPEQHDELKAWKRSMSMWYTERKVRVVSYGRFYTALRQARQFRESPELFFVYFADSRGRLYPMTYGVNPQGSDLQKALLHFAEAKPVHTEHAEKWFLVQGANKFGYDKDTLAGRCAWVHERHEQFMAFAAAPLDNLGWMQADKPLQFLAWCFEYADWKTDPGFMSRLPISMDGSCNGLQNFSAMLRDERGGKATNLTANAIAQDIYAEVAASALERLKRLPDDPEGFKARWLAHGVNRKITKKSVMTTPYGVTRNTASKYVVSEYLEDPAISHPFEVKEYGNAARFLMQAVWPAIGDVVVKSREAMAWLRNASRAVLDQHKQDGNPDPVVSWVTPSGFLATQGYFEIEIHRIRTLLHGEVKIRVAQETDSPDATRHASGMAPNFVHSMDAAHLHLVAAKAAERGVTDLAMIHDDYGTHAANSEALFHIIREEFYTMYTENDPLAQLCERYPFLAEPPAKGSLDLSEVLRSEFFFS